jgi:hypothetical protein
MSEDPTTLSKKILYLYRSQTQAEQSAASTHESNGVGFNMVDAPFMTSLAEQILRGKPLSTKQLAVAALRLPKYKNQLGTGWETIALPTPRPIIETDFVKPIAPKPDHSGVLSIGDRNELMFTPNVYPSGQIKTIGFTRWDGKAWHQSKPSVTKQAVEDVKKLFGKIEVAQHIEQLLNVAYVTLPAEIENNPQLFDYQKETIKFQLTYPHSLISLAPRLGKTVTTIFAVKAANCQRVLVVAPLSLLLDWKAKIKRWSGEDAAVVYKKQVPVPARWTVTNYDTLRLHLATFIGEGWDAIIIDESLLIKNRKAIRTKTIQKLVKDTKPRYTWLLSGAPTSKFYTDLWSQLNILQPSRFTSYWRFAERYCLIEANQWSAYNIISNKPDAADNIKKDLEDVYFARTQEQVLNLPPWHIESVSVAMSKYQDKMYTQMEDDFMAAIEDGDRVLAPNMLVQMLRLIQIASNPLLIGGKDDSNKWKAAVEMLEYEQSPTIVWTAFIDTANHLTAALQAKKFVVGRLTGSTAQGERQAIVNSFQNGQLDVVVAHPAVGKYGLDLYNAKTVIYLERTHDGDSYYQSLNRVRHIEAKTSPHIVHLLSSRPEDKGGTIDNVIDQVLRTKREDVLKLTTGNLRNLLKEAVQ